MSSAPLTPAPRDSAFSGWLDVFRALAAFAVLYSHARALFLTSATGAEPFSVKVLYLLSGYGHLAVMVFFVLSGYLVGGTVIRAVRDGRWSWSDYLLRRGTRLYIVLIPALLLTLCWDYGEKVQSTRLTPNNDTAAANITSETIRAHTSAGIFAGNAAFLQTVVVPPLGSNTPLWSLANEFWYYLVFPFVWLGLRAPNLRILTRVAYLGVAGITLYLLGPAIAIYFAVWLLGVLVALLPETRSFQDRRRYRLTVALASFAVMGELIAATTVARNWTEMARDALVGVTFASLLYCLKHDHSPPRARESRRLAAFFADFSYTLYLVHLPPLIFLRACLTYEVAWIPVASSWLKLTGIMGGIVLYAFLMSLVTERQTESLRKWLTRHSSCSKQQAPHLAPMEVS